MRKVHPIIRSMANLLVYIIIAFLTIWVLDNLPHLIRLLFKVFGS